jgi:hypothetical protein
MDAVDDELTADDLTADDAAAAMELWLGAPAGGSQFVDREELEEAWTRLRDVVMSEYAKGGRRPMGWWQFDAPPGLRYDDAHERSLLYEANVIVGEERRELERYWKEEFAEAFRRHGGDRRARYRHFRDVDLPASLRKRFSAERKRAARTIHKLTATKEACSAGEREKPPAPAS